MEKNISSRQLSSLNSNFLTVLLVSFNLIMGATDDHESLVLTRSCIQSFFFFFPADAVTVFGAETTGLVPFSEQARQTGLTTLYWRFISSFTSASVLCFHICNRSGQSYCTNNTAFPLDHCMKYPGVR